MKMRPIPPAPFPTRKGGAHGFLKVCIPSCSDGFERMDHAMNLKKTSRHSPRKTAHRSPFLLGRGLGGRSPSEQPSLEAIKGNALNEQATHLLLLL